MFFLNIVFPDYIIMDLDSAFMSSLSNYSPYELVFGKKPKLLLDLETDSDIKVLVPYKEYYERLEQRLKYLQKVLFDFKMK